MPSCSALVFGSFLAGARLIIAAVSILGTFLLLGVLTTVTGVNQLVEYLVALIGLGVAIDYSLLLVTRWREERDQGRSNDEAVVVAMSTAGRSVLFSGVTVAFGLFALVACLSCSCAASATAACSSPSSPSSPPLRFSRCCSRRGGLASTAGVPRPDGIDRALRGGPSRLPGGGVD